MSVLNCWVLEVLILVCRHPFRDPSCLLLHSNSRVTPMAYPRAPHIYSYLYIYMIYIYIYLSLSLYMYVYIYMYRILTLGQEVRKTRPTWGFWGAPGLCSATDSSGSPRGWGTSKVRKIMAQMPCISGQRPLFWILSRWRRGALEALVP